MISLKHILEGVEYGDTLIEIYLAVLYECNEPQLSGKTVLTREFQGLNKPAAKVKTEADKPYGTKSALGLMDKPVIKDLFDIIKDKYGLSNFIYCSHGKSKFMLTSKISYIVVPKNPFKLIWNEHVKDIFAHASNMYTVQLQNLLKDEAEKMLKDLGVFEPNDNDIEKKIDQIRKGELGDNLEKLKKLKDQINLGEFPIDSYTDSWPSGDVAEVLLDCEYYFLINQDAELMAESKHHTGISSIQTYDQLATVLDDVFNRPDMRGQNYKEKYTSYDWSGIDTPADPDM